MAKAAPLVYMLGIYSEMLKVPMPKIFALAS